MKVSRGEKVKAAEKSRGGNEREDVEKVGEIRGEKRKNEVK